MAKHMHDDGRDMQTGSRARICTVKYRWPESTIGSSAGVLILLAIKEDAGLKLYTLRAFSEQISEHDQEYISELLEDLSRRGKMFPNQVFKQLSDLSVGPIVTDSVSWIELCDSTIGELYPDFCLYSDFT